MSCTIKQNSSGPCDSTGRTSISKVPFLLIGIRLFFCLVVCSLVLFRVYDNGCVGLTRLSISHNVHIFSRL